ncbi:MAG: Excinuclease ABC C subunit domain protein [Candidatus Wolfebacteria bacterium GW2011_GWC1_43_10]|uniref:Excinuclease ABC C subunit domain protein n=1 Tax=Candidatus Wolfebacteria bacterium GW2011_GWC1_43_10 TaxID=1619011 RepID=A0A0G1C7V8_9BACT|nr:MAG: Excinuclease ABC C subunit domain protein [Candidatus Wolfebacteria bacterium GW2011_GWC1_43_10]KKT22114.1 MAG: Excinuclease ABC C subunit domain protein [Parcubacteria group bacterium GW2011_GWB1_43_8b]KKT85646.1 MAG: Excinuclease ABC C subunit domain protein [Parcubacteria group bacterium GW2011_GWA1_Parcubacteria_45_10]
MSYHYVYVLNSREDGDNYVGCTDNLNKRLKQHNLGQVYSTRKRRPLDLVYAEIFLNQQDAYEREKFLKSGWGKNYLKRVLKNYWSKKLGG